MKRKFVHYGSNRFDLSLFHPIKNDYGFDKPKGGLWACDVKTRFGWKEYCLTEGMFPTESPRLNTSFIFKLKKGTKIYHAEKVEDFIKFPINWDEYDARAAEDIARHGKTYLNDAIDPFKYIDWEQLIYEGYDVVEYIRTPFGHDVFYGWDFNSILVLNPYVVKQIA